MQYTIMLWPKKTFLIRVQCNLDLAKLNQMTNCNFKMAIFPNTIFQFIYWIITFSDFMRFRDSFFEDRKVSLNLECTVHIYLTHELSNARNGDQNQCLSSLEVRNKLNIAQKKASKKCKCILVSCLFNFIVSTQIFMYLGSK